MTDKYPEGDAKRARGGTPEEADQKVNTRSGRSTKNPPKSPQGETVALDIKGASPTSAQPGVAEPAEADVQHAHGERRRFRRLRRPLLSSSEDDEEPRRASSPASITGPEAEGDVPVTTSEAEAMTPRSDTKAATSVREDTPRPEATTSKSDAPPSQDRVSKTLEIPQPKASEGQEPRAPARHQPEVIEAPQRKASEQSQPRTVAPRQPKATEEPQPKASGPHQPKATEGQRPNSTRRQLIPVEDSDEEALRDIAKRLKDRFPRRAVGKAARAEPEAQRAHSQGASRPTDTCSAQDPEKRPMDLSPAGRDPLGVTPSDQGCRQQRTPVETMTTAERAETVGARRDVAPDTQPPGSSTAVAAVPPGGRGSKGSAMS